MFMSDRPVSQIYSHIKERIKSPLVIFFAIGWLHTNYDLVLYVTSLDLGADKKIEFIKQYRMLSITNMFCYPLGTAIFLYFVWYFLDALSKGLMEKHDELVRVVSSRAESFIHRIDIPKNKIKRMENNIAQLTSSLSSEKIRNNELQRQLIQTIKNSIFNIATDYELSQHERNTIHKSDERYFIVKSKSRMDDYKFKEFDMRLQKLQATTINNYSGDSDLIAIDLDGIVDAIPRDIIAEIKYYGLEIIDRVSSLSSSKTK